MRGFGSFFTGDARPGLFGGLIGPRFSCEPRCYPVSSVGRGDLEFGNRLILPPSALHRLQEIGAPSPFLFEVSDLEGRHRTHAGVLEFVAEEETCHMPAWIMRQLQAQEGNVLRVALKVLPKATFARFQPASVALLRVYNPRALLENGLRGFAALTVGDTFAVEYSGQKYGLEVVELRPGPAVCIIDTDVEVEFATPLDAENAASRATSRPSTEGSEQGGGDASPATSPAKAKVFSGLGRRIDGAIIMPLADDTTAAEGEDGMDDMPWKQRIPHGVKWTMAPYGFDIRRVTGEVLAARPASGSSTAPSGAAGAVPAPVVAPPPPPEDARERALEAAEVRYALNAEDIERRKKEEEEERGRQRAKQEKEEAERHAREEAKRRKAAALAAPAQQRMDGGGGPRKPAANPAWCCSCFRSNPPAKAAMGSRL